MNIAVFKYNINLLLTTLVLVVEQLVDDVVHRANLHSLAVGSQGKIISIWVET